MSQKKEVKHKKKKGFWVELMERMDKKIEEKSKSSSCCGSAHGEKGSSCC